MENEHAVSVMEFEWSPTVGKIGAALAGAQAKIASAKADSVNPHFGSHYADLASVIDAVRTPLAEAAIARHQALVSHGLDVGVRTALIHSSGEWIASTVWCKTDGSPQKMGSVVTYLRRYSLSAAVGLAQDDDDANSAQGTGKEPKGKAAAPKLDTKVQARIKILQVEAGISDEEWREKLNQYYRVTTSSALNDEQARELISRLEARKAARDKAPQGGEESPKSS